MAAATRIRLVTAVLAAATAVLVAMATVRVLGRDESTSTGGEEAAAQLPLPADGGEGGPAAGPNTEATGGTAGGQATGGPRLPITAAEAAAVRAVTDGAVAPTMRSAPSSAVPTVSSTVPTASSTVPATTVVGATAPVRTSVPQATVGSTAGVSTTARATTAPPSSPPSTAPATTRSASTRPPTTQSPVTLAPTTQPAAGLSGVEWEIVRLTNELRTNPTGPEARKKPQPSCVETDDAGQPRPVPALSANEAVSIQLARDWSIAMDRAGAMTHRPGEAQEAIYRQLGISVRMWGENVAWFSGYTDAQAARVFFEGWRESDGHYCNMMATGFTHFGVGVHKGARSTWATQNFYASR